MASSKNKKNQYYSLKRILQYDAQYNVIMGSRSTGKTFAVLEYCIKEYCQHGSEFAIIRRWYEDFKGRRGQTMFAALEDAGVIQKYTNGMWTNVVYRSMQFYFGKYLDGKLVTSDKPIGYAFTLASTERDKSTSYPNVRNILFDEFMSRSEFGYLNSEFVLFMNTLSTIIRQRDDAKIFLAGNTVNMSCIYFNELGLTNIKKMKPGTIDIYEYGDSGLRVAVEYTEPYQGEVTSNKYFAFNNPRLKMITGSDGGSWEIDIYPHLPNKYAPKDIILTYFIIFDGVTIQAEVIQQKNNIFTYMHRKTTELRNPDEDIIFSTDYDPRPNWIRNIYHISNPKLARTMSKVFDTDKIFYQDNELGEYVRNYLVWCKRN